MQFSKLLVFFFALSFSTAAISEDTDTFTLDASQFNLSMVGFVGRVSKAEAAMVDIGKRKNAGSIFFLLSKMKIGALSPNCMPFVALRVYEAHYLVALSKK